MVEDELGVDKDEEGFAEDEIRWALLRLGKAGGRSSSTSISVSVSSPSSSDGGGEEIVKDGGGGGAVAKGKKEADEGSQARRYDVMVE